MIRQYGYDVRTVDHWLKEALSGDGVWFARWATDQLLKFKMSNKVTDYVWASWVLLELKDVMDYFQRVTVEADNTIARDGMQDTEAKRFDDLFSLLEEMLNSTREFLQTTPKSRVGIEELLSIAHESDIVCMGNDFSIRLTYRDMRNTQRMSRSACYKVISGHLVARLRARKHSVPVENAIRIMLQVIPLLDWETLQHIHFGDWCETLTNYGFAAYADTLGRYILEYKDWLDVGGVTPLSVVSHSLRTPSAVFPLDPRPPPSFDPESPGQKNDDDDDDDFSTPGSKEWEDVMLSAKRNPHQPVNLSSNYQPTFEQLFQPGRAQPGEVSRSRGLTYDRSDRSTKRTPSVKSNESDSSQESTPRPVKRVRVIKERIGNGDSVTFGQATPRPRKASQMDMGTLSGALADVQRGRANAPSAEVIAPTIERSDPVTVASPNGRGDLHDTEAAGAIEHDDDVVMLGVEGADKFGDHMVQKESKGVHKKGDSIEDADAAKYDDAHEDNPAGDDDDPVDNDGQPSEINPTKWRDTYSEYKSWPRDLKIYGKINLILHSGVRKDMLRCLKRSEATGVECWWQNGPGKLERGTEDLEADLSSIRAAVKSAMKQRARKGQSKTLAEVIDQNDEGTTFDPISKTILPRDITPVPDDESDKSSEEGEGTKEEEEDEDEDEEPTKWRRMYAEYKAFPRPFNIYDRLELKLYNPARMTILRALSRAESRGKSCKVRDLKELNELYDDLGNDTEECIEHDMEAIRTMVRGAEKRKYRGGKGKSLRALIDCKEPEGSDMDFSD